MSTFSLQCLRTLIIGTERSIKKAAYVINASIYVRAHPPNAVLEILGK